VAGVLMSLLNLALWVVAAWLTRDILRRTAPAGRQIVALVVALILSGRFFMDNFHHVQMNGVTFALALLGIRAFLDGRDEAAAAAFVTATALKVTPIFFTAWLLIRGGRRAAVAVVLLALACGLAPLVLRGPSCGVAELREYYHVFLEKHEHGGIEQYTAGQNLAALVSRMTLAPVDSNAVSYRWVPATRPTAQLLYRTLWAAVLLLFLGRLLWLRVHRAPVSPVEPAMVFATALLLSPITFTTHLVPLLYILAAVLSLPLASLGPATRVAAALLGVGLLVCGLGGRDLAGGTMYVLVGGYSVCAWTLLALFGVTLGWSGRPIAASHLSGPHRERSEGPS